MLTTPVPEAFWQPDMIIYHDRCADGIVAAWACWKRWGDAPEYRAANYGHKPPEDVAGKHILIVDFSWPADELLAMTRAGAKSIIILDHHKTAEAALDGVRFRESSPGAVSAGDVSGLLLDLRDLQMPPILAIFDMERSGARMAWDFVQPFCAPPRLVQLAERYDLWRFEPGTRDHAEVLHLTIQAAPMRIAIMEQLYHQLEDGDGPLIEGSAIYDWRAQLVEEIASRAHLRTVAGVEGVISVECPYSLVSAVGHHLLDKHPAAPFAAMSVTGEHAVTWSLRSHDDRADVSEVAKSMGGGGHRNAAGFRIDRAGEADYKRWRAIDPDHVPDGTIDSLETCAAMLETYGPDCFPANEHGQVHFARSMMDATAEEIRAYLANVSSDGAGSSEALVKVVRENDAVSAVDTFQGRVQPWLLACFGEVIAGDREERNHRFLEEALELVQSLGCTEGEAHQLVDYVYGREIGQPMQEAGGVMVTLAALCLANRLDMYAAGETELARVWTKVEAIRAKQAAKPKHSPLPEHVEPAASDEPVSGRPCRFVDCPPGLFRWQGLLCFKSEYSTKAGQPDAYCVDSGEYFWGGTNGDLDARRQLIVTPSAPATQAPDGYASAFYEVAKLLDIGARADSPANVWRREMLPRLKALLDKPAVVHAAVEEIADERRRQVDIEGWTPEHDDKHRFDHALPRAAACYALAGLGGSGPFWINALQVPHQVWPYRWEWKPGDQRRNLVKAGALIVAEIERLDRAAAVSEQSA